MTAPPIHSPVHWWQGSKLLTAPGPSLPSVSSKVVVLLPWIDRAKARQAIETMVWRAGVHATYVALQDDTAAGPVALLNAAMPRVDCEAVAYVAEDAFAGRYWLRRGLACLNAQPGRGLLAFNDGKWFGRLAGFGLVRRQWLAPLYGGRLFHPDYRRHYGDTELSVVALQQGAMAYDPEAVLVEVDHGKDGRKTDPADRMTFMVRSRTGFDGYVSSPSLLSIFC